MRQAKDYLEVLAREEGVDFAMVVSRDGFIIEMEAARPPHLEPETIGAAVSTYWATADRRGSELGAGGGVNGIFEFKDGIIATSLMAENDLILTIAADRRTNPATVRYLTTRFSQLLEQVL